MQQGKSSENDKAKGKGKGKERALQSTLVQALDKFFKLQSSLMKLKGAHPIMYPVISYLILFYIVSSRFISFLLILFIYLTIKRDDAKLNTIIQAVREISGDNTQELDTTSPTTSTTTTESQKLPQQPSNTGTQPKKETAPKPSEAQSVCIFEGRGGEERRKGGVME